MEGTLLPERGHPGAGLLRLVCSVWVLDFVQGRFHSGGPGGFERMFIKVGTVK